jgi:GAF domain-containing protein
MHINRKLLVLIGIGMLLFLGILVISLINVMVADDTLIKDEETRAREMRGIETIVNELGNMSLSSHQYLANTRELHRQAFYSSRDTVYKMLDTIVKQNRHVHDQQLATAVRLAVQQIDEPAGQLFTLTGPLGRDRSHAYELAIEMDNLLTVLQQRIQRYISDERAEQMNIRAAHLRFVEKRNMIIFLLTLLVSISFLLGFGIYIRRTVALPLNELWKSAAAPHAGNLERTLQQEGPGSVPLTTQLNEMVRDLRQLSADLEQKLDRSNDRAAIESVALTLGQTGDLRDMLTKSLGQILNSLADLEMKGGAFLCDQNGETLSLVAHQGLPPEFVQQEQTISMGECLCGIAAQTGEIIYTEKSCNDPRHTRGKSTDKHSHVIIPIKSRGTVLGVIFLYPRIGFQLNPAELQMLETIGTQLGLAVENLELFAEVKESRQKAHQEKLTQAERLDAMEQAVAAVRHEINNPLSTIIGNAELLMDRPADAVQDQEFLTRLEVILNNALRIADIVKQMQDISQDKIAELKRETDTQA